MRPTLLSKKNSEYKPQNIIFDSNQVASMLVNGSGGSGASGGGTPPKKRFTIQKPANSPKTKVKQSLLSIASL
jgi:hypothetical protein